MGVANSNQESGWVWLVDKLGETGDVAYGFSVLTCEMGLYQFIRCVCACVRVLDFPTTMLNSVPWLSWKQFVQPPWRYLKL